MKKAKILAIMLACAFACGVGTACTKNDGSNGSELPAEGENAGETNTENTENTGNTEGPEEETPKTPYMQVTAEQWAEFIKLEFTNLTLRTVGWKAPTKEEISLPENKIEENLVKYDTVNYRIESRSEENGEVKSWHFYAKEGVGSYNYKYLVESQSWIRWVDAEEGLGPGYQQELGM